MDKTAALSGIASLSELPRSLMDQLAKLSGLQRIGRGSTLFREGEAAHFVYVIMDGSVSLLSGSEGEQTISDFMEAGEIILIAPALLQLPYMVTAKAVTDLEVIMIPATEFRRLAQTELPLAIALNRILSGHWRLLLKHLTHTKSRDADTRLTQYLIDNVAIDFGPAQFTLPGSKRELAAHLGITPATLSRSLKRLSPLGVSTSGSHIWIEDISRLKPPFMQSSRAGTGSAAQDNGMTQ